MTRTATQLESRSGDTVGDSSPGVILRRGVDELRRQVVVHQHVLVGDHDALDAASQRLEARHVVLGGDQQSRRLQDDGAEDLETLPLERGAGLDDVGDRIRDPESDRGLDRPIQTHHGRVDALARRGIAATRPS